MPNKSNKNLGEFLLEAGVIAPADLQEALRRQALTGRRLGVELREMGICTPEDVEWALSAQFQIPFVRLSAGHVDLEAAKLIPAELARTGILVPTWLVGNTLHVVMADPTNDDLVERVREAAGRSVQFSLGLPSEIRRAIDEAYGETGQTSEESGRGLYDSHFLSDDEQVEINRDPTGRLFLEGILRKGAGRGVRGVLFEIRKASSVVRVRDAGGWTEAARCRRTWLEAVLDVIDEFLDESAFESGVRTGWMSIPGGNDGPEIEWGIRLWALGDGRAAVALPRPARDPDAEHAVEGMPADLFTGDGIVVVDFGHGSGLVGLRAVAEVAAADPRVSVFAAGMPGRSVAGSSRVELPEGLPLSQAWRMARELPVALAILGNPTGEDPVPLLVDARLRGRRLVTTCSGRSAVEVAERLRGSRLSSALGEVRLVEAAEVPILCLECRTVAPGASDLRRTLALPADSKLMTATGCRECGGTGIAEVRRVAAAARLVDVGKLRPLVPVLLRHLAAGELSAADFLEWTEPSSGPPSALSVTEVSR